MFSNASAMSALAWPSTPMPTFTPSERYFGMSAMPEASRPFESGCHDIPEPAAAVFCSISSVVWMK
jgi:hypothetical protein